jgi:hypothetical protein
VGVLVFTPGATPSWNPIAEWCETEFTKKLGVQFTQIQVLDESKFLISFDSFGSCQGVLAVTSKMLHSRMVLVQAYDPSVDIPTLQYKNTSVWIDLLSIHPILEVEANSMLETVGPVLHSTIKYNRRTFQTIRACVLVDLLQPLVDGIEIEDGEDRSGIIPVHYRDLPRNCPKCKQEGDLPVSCPGAGNGSSGAPAPPHKTLSPPAKGTPKPEASPDFASNSSSFPVVPPGGDFIEVNHRKASRP